MYTLQTEKESSKEDREEGFTICGASAGFIVVLNEGVFSLSL